MKLGGQTYFGGLRVGDLGASLYATTVGSENPASGDPGAPGGASDTIRTFPTKTNRAFFNFSQRVFPVS